MIKQWEGNAKKKFYLILALGLALIISGGAFVYTYVNSLGTIGILPPTGEFATCNTAASQPNWNSVLIPPGTTNTTVLRPNAAGDETNVQSQLPASGAHWDKVDEATPDGDSLPFTPVIPAGKKTYITSLTTPQFQAT